MLSDGNRSDAQSELSRTIRKLISRQKAVEKKVERLETLEFNQKSIGQGCVTFVDFDLDIPAPGHTPFLVEFQNSPLPSGNEEYSHATIFWALSSNEQNPAMINLFMRWGLAAEVDQANYYYSYKWSRGGAIGANVGLGAQTEWFIGRVPAGVHEAYGEVTVPFLAGFSQPGIFGQWTAYDITQSANSREEHGEFGGHYIGAGGSISIRQFYIFAAVGNIRGSVYLYGWCPEMTNVGGPDD